MDMHTHRDLELLPELLAAPVGPKVLMDGLCTRSQNASDAPAELGDIPTRATAPMLQLLGLSLNLVQEELSTICTTAYWMLMLEILGKLSPVDVDRHKKTTKSGLAHDLPSTCPRLVYFCFILGKYRRGTL